MIKKLFLLICLFALSCGAPTERVKVVSMGVPLERSKVSELILRHRFSEAISSIPDTADAGAILQKGYCLCELDSFRKAASVLSHPFPDNELLEPYRAYLYYKSLISGGLLDSLELADFAALEDSIPEPLVGEYLVTLADGYRKIGKYDSEYKILDRLLSLPAGYRGISSYQIRYRQGVSLVRRGKTSEGKKRLSSLVKEILANEKVRKQNITVAISSADFLVETAPDNPGYLFLAGMANYYKKGNRREALSLFERAEKKGYKRRRRALYWKALCYRSFGNYQKAEDILTWLFERGYSTGWVCYQLGLIRRSQGRFSDAVKYFERSVRQKDSSSPHSLFKLAEMHRWNMGKLGKSAAYYERLRNYRRSSFYDIAALRSGLVRFWNGEYKKARENFAFINRKNGFSDEAFLATARFWEARACIALGDSSSADSLFRLISDKPVFYGYEARFLLAGSEPDFSYHPVGRREISSLFSEAEATLLEVREKRVYLVDDVTLIRGRLLASLGLVKYARMELRCYRDRFVKSPMERLYLWRELVQCHLFSDAVLTAELLAASFPDERSVLRLSHPVFFADEVDSLSRKAGFSPYLLLALIRKESCFDPYIISCAGATGLCQMMPGTAEKLSPDVSGELFDYRVNLSLGADYLSSLLGKFDGDVYCALAGYNAGDDAVSKWESKYLDGTRWSFIENIDYRETRHYVKRLLTYFYTYQELWG
ncbi:hypothetical protein DRQ19_03315 [bacterium]|nr:MAG: hypothetical protein DRQ19_03315 [bacterium]